MTDSDQAKQANPNYAAPVQHIAETFHLPRNEVSSIYKREMEQLLERAKVRDYVPLLAARRTHDALSDRRRPR